MQGCCQGHPGLEATNSLEQGVQGTGVQCQPGWAPTVDSCSDYVQKCGASPAHTCLPVPARNPQSPPPITVVTFCVNLHVPSNQMCSQALVADLSLSSLTLACSSSLVGWMVTRALRLGSLWGLSGLQTTLGLKAQLPSRLGTPMHNTPFPRLLAEMELSPNQTRTCGTPIPMQDSELCQLPGSHRTGST